MSSRYRGISATQNLVLKFFEYFLIGYAHEQFGSQYATVPTFCPGCYKDMIGRDADFHLNSCISVNCCNCKRPLVFEACQLYAQCNFRSCGPHPMIIGADCRTGVELFTVYKQGPAREPHNVCFTTKDGKTTHTLLEFMNLKDESDTSFSDVLADMLIGSF